MLTFSFLILTFSIFYYLHIYYSHYPFEYSGEWQYGYKEAVIEVQKYYDDVDNVYITGGLGRPYIYFLLYMNTNPSEFQQYAVINKDKLFFLEVERFKKLKFGGVDNY